MCHVCTYSNLDSDPLFLVRTSVFQPPRIYVGGDLFSDEMEAIAEIHYVIKQLIIESVPAKTWSAPLFFFYLRKLDDAKTMRFELLRL